MLKKLFAFSLLLSVVAFAFPSLTASKGVNVVKAGGVNWSAEGQTYNNTVLPCVMDNAVKAGMPAMVKAKAMCVLYNTAVLIAEQTDERVDVMDFRAAFVSYMYAGMGYEEDYSFNYLYKCETGENVTNGVNCLEGTGIQPANSEEVWGWVHDHADEINSALESACQTCGASAPSRPVIPEFTAISAILTFGFAAILITILFKKRPNKNKICQP